MPRIAPSGLLILLVLLPIWSLITNAAYQSSDCPSPCRCLLFDGLRSVYCNRTGIAEVPSGIPSNAELLDLSYNAFRHIDKDAFSGLSDLVVLDISSNVLGGASIETGALDLPKLATLDLSYNQFSAVPKVLPINMTKLWFMNNHLTVLRRDSFSNYIYLQYIDVSNNHMTRIEPLSFDMLGKLQTLYIAFNNLTDHSFPPNAFAKNANLQILSMRFNEIAHLLDNLPVSLQHLDYVGNKIETLPAYGFRSLPNLQTMGFWQGQVTTIEDNAFYGLSQVTLLDFMQDQIASTITNYTFNGLTGLKTLYLDINQVSEIQPGALRAIPSINSLWMTGNNLTHLDPEVLNEKYITHLSELYIDSNPWYCDCHLRWLREKVDNATYVIQDPGLIMCAGPSKVAGKAWDVLKPSDFVC